MTQITLKQTMALAITIIVLAVRRVRLRLALRDCDYILAHIAATRANDYALEKMTHQRQARLAAELRQIRNRP